MTLNGITKTVFLGPAPLLLKAYLSGNITTSGMGNFSPSARDNIAKYGGEIIQKITIMRTPLPATLQSALNVVSLLEFKKRKSKLPYDDLYHLFLVVHTNKRKLLLEKNDVILFQSYKNLQVKETDVMPVQNVPSNLSVVQMLIIVEKKMGRHRFYSYNARSNNCQHFILNVLKANNIGSSQNYEFIKQEFDELFEKMPIFNKIVNSVTATGAISDILIQGEGMNKERKTSPWISHVKSYASKNKMSYRDALKCEICKSSYKKIDRKKIKGGSVDGGVIGVIVGVAILNGLAYYLYCFNGSCTGNHSTGQVYITAEIQPEHIEPVLTTARRMDVPIIRVTSQAQLRDIENGNIEIPTAQTMVLEDIE